MNAFEKSVFKDTALSAGLLAFAVAYLAIATLRGPAPAAAAPDLMAGQAAERHAAAAVVQPPQTVAVRHA